MVAVDPLISVIIPTYNYGVLLPRALDSVLGQITDDVELIVVNDGSTDHTQEVLCDYASRVPALQILYQDNAGAAAARNYGIRVARGRYALLLDADDELTKNALAILLSAVALYPNAGLLLGGKVSVYPDGRQRIYTPIPMKPADPCTLARRYLLQKRISISHGSSLFKRDLLLQRPYPEQLRGMEDIPVFLHMLISAPVHIVEQSLVKIHKHAGSLRHLRKDSEKRALMLIEEVFATLPRECIALRKPYKAQRYLSLFRAALVAGEASEARHFYRTALNQDCWHALQWSYLRKALRLWLVQGK